MSLKLIKSNTTYITKTYFDNDDAALINLLLYYQDNYYVSAMNISAIYESCVNIIVHDLQYKTTINNQTWDQIDNILSSYLNDDNILVDTLDELIYDVIRDCTECIITLPEYMPELIEIQSIAPCLSSQYYTIDDGIIKSEKLEQQYQYYNDDYNDVLCKIYGDLLSEIMIKLLDSMHLLIANRLYNNYYRHSINIIIDKYIDGYIIYTIDE